jgi:hypothetical protein
MRKKAWTKQSYDALCKSVREDLKGGCDDDPGDCLFYDIADSLLDRNEDLRAFINKELGASDVKGRLADDISF